MSEELFHRDARHADGLRHLHQTVRVRLRRQATDLAHDFTHIERVWGNAERVGRACARDEGWTVDGDILEAAVWLHELGRGVEQPGEHTADASVRVAEEVLRNGGLSDLVWGVCETILSHESPDRSPESAEAMILRDADLLEDVGAIGVARAFLVSAARAVPALYEPDDPAGAGRDVDPGAYVLDALPPLHSIVERMHTPSGRLEARRRLKIVGAFHQAFLREAGFDR